MKTKRIGYILIGLLVGMFALDLIFEMLNASCSIVNILALVILIIGIMIAIHLITKKQKDNENI